MLDAGCTARDPPEVVSPEPLLVHRERAVVGADASERPALETVPEGLAVARRADRRGDHVGGALEVGLLVHGVVQQEVLWARLADDPGATAPGGGDGVAGLAAGDVDDVQPGARERGQRRDARGRLALGLRGARERMEPRVVGLGRGQAVAEALDHLPVLRVREDDRVELGGGREHVDEIVVDEADRLQVGEVDLERGGSGLDGPAHPLRSPFVPPGDRHVEGVIAAGDRSLSAPGLEGLEEVLSPLRVDEVDEGGGPADERGGRAAVEIVRGDGARHREGEVHVRVHAPGDDEEPRGVDPRFPGRRPEVRSQLHDPSVADPYVASPPIGGGDDVAVLDEEAGHRDQSTGSGRNPERANPFG